MNSFTPNNSFGFDTELLHQDIPHHQPKAKRVIYLFQPGAPSFHFRVSLLEACAWLRSGHRSEFRWHVSDSGRQAPAWRPGHLQRSTAPCLFVNRSHALPDVGDMIALACCAGDHLASSQGGQPALCKRQLSVLAFHITTDDRKCTCSPRVSVVLRCVQAAQAVQQPSYSHPQAPVVQECAASTHGQRPGRASGGGDGRQRGRVHQRRRRHHGRHDPHRASPCRLSLPSLSLFVCSSPFVTLRFVRLP